MEASLAFRGNDRCSARGAWKAYGSRIL